MTYRRWISEIENNGTATEARTHNKQLPYIRLLKRIPFDLAIFDEAHNAANLMSNQGTAFIRLAATAKKVLALTRPEPAPVPPSIAVIHCEDGREVTRDLPFGMYQTLLDAGALEFTLFGVYVRTPAPRRKYA